MAAQQHAAAAAAAAQHHGYVGGSSPRRTRHSARDLPRHASFETVRGVAAAQENLRAAQAAAAAAASSRHHGHAHHPSRAGGHGAWMAKEHEMGSLLEAHGRWLHSLAREVAAPPSAPTHAW